MPAAAWLMNLDFAGGAAVAVATVAKRFDLKGADNQNFELLGSSSAALKLKGSDDQNFPLVGDP